MSQFIIVQYESPAIVIVTLNRPEKRNALSIAVMHEFLEVLTAAEGNPEARVLLIKGAGDIFCAGLDLDEAKNPDVAETSAECVGNVLVRLHNTPLITIAVAQGAALAGGAGLLAACDFAIGADDLKLGFPEVKRGLIPALISMLLVKQVPWRQLREILLIGDPITAAQGCEMGLLTRTVPAGSLASTGLALAYHILEGAPQAVKLTKSLLNAIQDKNFGDELTEAHRIHMLARSSGEAAEGIRAFQEKRAPRWETVK